MPFSHTQESGESKAEPIMHELKALLAKHGAAGFVAVVVETERGFSIAEGRALSERMLSSPQLLVEFVTCQIQAHKSQVMDLEKALRLFMSEEISELRQSQSAQSPSSSPSDAPVQTTQSPEQ